MQTTHSSLTSHLLSFTCWQLATWTTVFACSALLGCSSDDSELEPVNDAEDVASTGGATGEGGATGGGDPELGADSLAGAYGDYFPIGVAVSPIHLTTASDILTSEFNHLTAENDMKAQHIQPSEGNFDFVNADAIADLARANNMTMTGHTLLWHRQAPTWFFSDLTPEDAGSIETLKARLKDHIDIVVPRYDDVVSNWDVVNEAISDDGSKTYRDASEGSKWYEYFGSEEYVYWAFKYAYDALEAIEPGNAKGKLYYNDYNVNLKVDRIIPLLDAVRDRGVPVDGIGMQAHVTLTWPSITELEATIDQIVDAGYDVKISELDMTIYSDYNASGEFEPQEEVAWSDALETQQATAYANLFALFREKKDVITSVTFWGVSDDHSWLNNEPVSGRTNYPLLWDADDQPKEAYFAVRDF